MKTADSELIKLSAKDRQTVESWLIDFDRNWCEDRLGEQVGKLPPPGNLLRLPALVEMVKIDLEKQWQHGRRTVVESYLRAYPELGTIDAVPADLILKEYQVRKQFGESPQLTTFLKRFSRRAQQLRPFLEQIKQSGVEPDLKSKETPRSNSPAQSTGPGGGVPLDLPERFGRYRIRKCLGRGGMGSVYLAHDTELDRDVALKAPHLSASDGPEVLERFYREARSAATLQHPHICPVHDVGQVDKIPYLTMAYIEGQPLSKFVEGGKVLSQRKVAELVRKVALALQEAHAKDIVHRDLKPSNIMINKRGEPVIMDFGLVLRKRDVRISMSGSVIGTPAYMPPEQLRGDTAEMGPTCDVYSLGAVLYELLTGRLPFEGPYMAVCAQILTQEPPPPSSHRPNLDAPLEAICRRAMAKNPAERYASMAEMVAALTKYLRGTSERAPVSAAFPVLPKAAEDTEMAPFADLNAERQSKAARPHRKFSWLWAGVTSAAAAIVVLSIVIVVRTRFGTTTDSAAPITQRNGKVDVTENVTSDHDYYASGEPGVWQPVLDNHGQRIRGHMGTFSSTGRELVVQRAEEPGSGAPIHLYIARRAGIDQRFGQPAMLDQISGPVYAMRPIFACGDRELYFVFRARDEKLPPGAHVRRCLRPSPEEAFGPPSEVLGLPPVLGMCCLSPDGLMAFYHPAGQNVLWRATRTGTDQPFKSERTNLPSWDPATIYSGIAPVAATNNGTLLFIWLQGGKCWFAAARTSGGASDYESPVKLFDTDETPVNYPPGQSTKAPRGFFLNPDASLLLSFFDGEASIKRLHESQKRKIQQFLGKQPSREPSVKTVAPYATTGTRWVGTYFRVGALPGEPKQTFATDQVIVIKEREGPRLVLEYWHDKETRGLLYEGTLDEKGNVTGKFLKIIRGEFPPMTPGSIGPLGRIDGKNWKNKFTLDGIHREFDVTLQEREGTGSAEKEPAMPARNQENAPTIPRAKAVDLLKNLVDPGKHTISGQWKLVQGMLTSSGDAFCRLQLPYRPPEEYRLEIVAAQVKEDKNTGNGLAVILPVGDNQTSAILGGWGSNSTTSGLVLVDGKGLALVNGKWVWTDNETTRRGTRVFTDATPRRLVYTVRKDSVHVTADDQTIIHWTGDAKRLGLIFDPKIDKRSLYVDTFALIHITKIEITETSANDARAQGDGARPPSKKPPQKRSRPKAFKAARIRVSNDEKQGIDVRLYHPSQPGKIYRTWHLDAGETTILAINGQEITIGSDWQIEIKFNDGKVSERCYVDEVCALDSPFDVRVSNMPR